MRPLLADDSLKRISVNKNICIVIQITQLAIPRVPVE